ncbi:FAD-binding oxidoreductase [Saccharopolyspora sp. K220]|uniref:FAD-binding oxidoreductase n=1 Tax=Saccharopolyspora soli TaxID=2926618 RepID=UPI001F59DED2|nr:FAD-binding oxidoreductase [Saccharopolyspora soli]MCI2423222.1 FAD-binding oxidoreductase [Saccharopolyspora soli]
MSDVSRRRMLLGSAAVIGGAVGLGAGSGAAAAARNASVEPARPVVVTPDDPRYPDLVRGSNRRWVGTPESVQLAGSTEHVIASVRDAVRSGKRLAVRSGGHCYEDFVYNPDVEVVVDLSVLNSVHYDSEHGAFVVEAGATLLDVYETLYRTWGVTIPGGSCESVGAGGHICGGGHGLLSRAHGLTIDHLHGVEVVVVDAHGEVRSVLATGDEGDPNRDLWWAHTGGGGGNFGVVTRYFLRTPGTAGLAAEQQLPKPPGEVFVYGLSWSWDDLTESSFRALLKNYGRWCEQNSAPGSPYTALSSKLALSTKASGAISLYTQMDATAPNSQALLDRYLAAVSDGVGTPEVDARRMPWLLATREHAATSWNRHSDYKSAYLRTGFPDDQIAVIYQYLTSYDNSGDLLQVDTYGGQINAIPPDATAAVHRDSIMKLQYQSYWDDPAEEPTRVQWLREFYRDVYQQTGGVPVPGAVNDGCYVNYPDTDLGDPAWNTSGVPWHQLYYKDAYPRLQQVKQRWDPTNTFRHAQSVQLPGAQ